MNPIGQPDDEYDEYQDGCIWLDHERLAELQREYNKILRQLLDNANFSARTVYVRKLPGL